MRARRLGFSDGLRWSGSRGCWSGIALSVEGRLDPLRHTLPVAKLVPEDHAGRPLARPFHQNATPVVLTHDAECGVERPEQALTLAFGQRFADMGLTVQLGVLEVPDPEDVAAVRRDRVLQQAHLLGLVDPGLVLVTVAVGRVVEHGARDGAADQRGDAVDRDGLDAGPRHVLVEEVLDPLDRPIVFWLLAQLVQLAALEFVTAPVGIDDECRLAQRQDERRFAIAVPALQGPASRWKRIFVNPLKS